MLCLESRSTLKPGKSNVVSIFIALKNKQIERLQEIQARIIKERQYLLGHHVYILK